jgi:hypothetical protein
MTVLTIGLSAKRQHPSEALKQHNHLHCHWHKRVKTRFQNVLDIRCLLWDCQCHPYNLTLITIVLVERLRTLLGTLYQRCNTGIHAT